MVDDKKSNEDSEAAEKAEMASLKKRAKTMGIKHSNNISLEKLREKVNGKLNGEPDTPDEDEDDSEDTNVNDDADEGESKQDPLDHDGDGKKGGSLPKEKKEEAPKLSLHQQLYNDNMKLVRISVACMNPAKADLPGEILTVANRYLGTVRKYVPFGEATDNGYHVPYCIYEHLKGREFLQVRTVKGKGGVPRIESKWVREFSVEVLEPLTQKELDDLATAQIAAGSMDN